MWCVARVCMHEMCMYDITFIPCRFSVGKDRVNTTLNRRCISTGYGRISQYGECEENFSTPDLYGSRLPDNNIGQTCVQLMTNSTHHTINKMLTCFDFDMLKPPAAMIDECGFFWHLDHETVGKRPKLMESSWVEIWTSANKRPGRVERAKHQESARMISRLSRPEASSRLLGDGLSESKAQWRALKSCLTRPFGSWAKRGLVVKFERF